MKKICIVRYRQNKQGITVHKDLFTLKNVELLHNKIISKDRIISYSTIQENLKGSKKFFRKCYNNLNSLDYYSIYLLAKPETLNEKKYLEKNINIKEAETWSSLFFGYQISKLNKNIFVTNSQLRIVNNNQLLITDFKNYASLVQSNRIDKSEFIKKILN